MQKSHNATREVHDSERGFYPEAFVAICWLYCGYLGAVCVFASDVMWYSIIAWAVGSLCDIIKVIRVFSVFATEMLSHPVFTCAVGYLCITGCVSKFMCLLYLQVLFYFEMCCDFPRLLQGLKSRCSIWRFAFYRKENHHDSQWGASFGTLVLLVFTTDKMFPFNRGTIDV